MFNRTNTTTFASLIEKARDFDSRKVDFDVDYKPGFAPSGKMFMGKGDQEVGPFDLSDNALWQLCNRLGSGTFGKGNNKSLPHEAIGLWLKDEAYAPHVAGLLNDHIERTDKKHFVRTYENTARAVLSGRYATVQNTDLLEKVDEAITLLGQQAGKDVTPQIFRSTVTPDNLYLRFRFLSAEVMPGGENTPYGFGALITNDEIGRGRVKVLPGLWRGSCDNTGYFEDGDMAINMRHVGDQQLIAQNIALVIAHSIKLGGEYLNMLMASKKIELPNIFSIISNMAESEGWSVEMTDTVRLGTEGQNNLYGLFNGITYAAHTYHADNQDAMTGMEIKAGNLLTNKAYVARLINED